MARGTDGLLLTGREIILDTGWFAVVARQQSGADPYYMLTLPDYVSVIALTAERDVLLVEQFRPVVERDTVELPSGHVDPGETPEQAARRELLEETGFVAARFDLLGTLVPDVGRLANRMWCYFAADARPGEMPHTPEPGVRMRRSPERVLLQQALDGRIDHALNLAALFLALASGRLRLETP